MPNSDFTLTSPLSAAATAERPLLALTIAWHPELQRVGEQFIAEREVALSRYLPLFRAPETEPAGLGYAGISRAPLRLVQDADGVMLWPPDSRMVVEVQGQEVTVPQRLTTAQIEAGVIIGLGRTVLLCLHWMRCLPQANQVPGLLGVGSAAIRLRALIRQAAGTGATVLLLGETGTGKEVAARAIHALSGRADQAMISVNMAALNESLAAADLFGASRGAYTGAQMAREGLFAEAEAGTLFLDEIGNAPPLVQPMLLRVLETGEYRPLGAQRDRRSGARLIAATDQDLYGSGFNQALLRRLEGFVIHLPPLRMRREDIGVLVLQALRAAGTAGGLAPVLPVALVGQLLCYHWPGNVRQLQHVLGRALLALRMGETPGWAELVDAVPAAPASVTPAAGNSSPAKSRTRTRLEDVSQHDVLQAMRENAWCVQYAAQALGVSRPSMYKLLEAHPAIRRVEQIAADELRHAWESSAGDVDICAARLQTPAEALRRHLRVVNGI
ncbi:AAA domain-containing protein [Duganella sp. FT135W]|uniref:AAA domain-containing protein n=1 Tax=Duganella flavida TaxID=2692175 RepID=A0A6L8K2W3_9BURK|nr:sigma 54-interacting transcriptional regulator [Duganella flavida]MYM21859.1 AAA domain-containing protein [Duganella flavida]